MTSGFICAPLTFAMLLAAAPAAADNAVAPATPPRVERKLFDFDLSRFYSAAAAQGLPAIMLPDRQRDAFKAVETPFAFTTPAWSQPGAFGHILDLPPPLPR